MDSLQSWVRACMRDRIPRQAVRLCAARNVKVCLEREVWDCSLDINSVAFSAILIVFKPGSLETVNTSLPPDLASEKCHLAMSELPSLGIPTPATLGHVVAEGAAAVLCERIARTEWPTTARIEAARLLARIHNLRGCDLSERLLELVRLSDPHENRTTGGNAPKCGAKSLVHGDFFSKNILPTTGSLRIIDWETFGWGDPMWDLGFLIGADRGLADDEIEAVITEYGLNAAINHPQLTWHRHRWLEFWKQRERYRNTTVV